MIRLFRSIGFIILLITVLSGRNLGLNFPRNSRTTTTVSYIDRPRLPHTSLRLSVVSPSGSSLEHTSDLERRIDVDNEQLRQEQRHLRFSGVGRLYVNDDNLENFFTPDNDEDHHPSWTRDPHLHVIDRLTAATVLVVGLGGVGSWSTEALCRSGIGNLVLVDLDDICISNTNRQLHATSKTVGKMKIDEMRDRIKAINPDCNVTNIHSFVTQENVHDILDRIPNISACLDAIDGAVAKAALVAACVDRRIPIVTCGGSAGRLDPTKICCDDLTQVEGDRLLRTVRTKLRTDYGFAAGLNWKERQSGKRSKKWRITAVYSSEQPKQLSATNGDKISSFRMCDGPLGTACFVTGTQGFIAASKLIDMIATDDYVLPRKVTQ